jgi:hypothetical protein
MCVWWGRGTEGAGPVVYKGRGLGVWGCGEVVGVWAWR